VRWLFGLTLFEFTALPRCCYPRNAARLGARRASVSAASNRKHAGKDREGVTVGDASSAKTGMNNIEAKTSHSQGKPCLSSGRRGRRLPRRRYRTVRETFASHGSSAYGLLSSAPQQLNLTIVAAWSVYPWSWRTRLRSSVRSRASVTRLELHKQPDLPTDRPHVSLSLALPRALASWGIPPTCGLRLAACSNHLESRR
jgi:hypothetical protein